MPSRESRRATTLQDLHVFWTSMVSGPRKATALAPVSFWDAGQYASAVAMTGCAVWISASRVSASVLASPPPVHNQLLSDHPQLKILHRHSGICEHRPAHRFLFRASIRHSDSTVKGPFHTIGNSCSISTVSSITQPDRIGWLAAPLAPALSCPSGVILSPVSPPPNSMSDLRQISPCFGESHEQSQGVLGSKRKANAESGELMSSQPTLDDNRRPRRLHWKVSLPFMNAASHMQRKSQARLST
ncbi:uncharacterized protein BJ171DRAFT_155012 [Polychytrium aggregatum]|uniref:uncharacterized protein n=1 Tax=Polychytrium aggregatum TaxID=110093 RepID=UPI0022FE241B|nr:uncharacterized protein BJ171DRAFT_155012 [Polychytrium aggregatum]KAI9203220.1 hypothetical protein BJ171DRAFT_155012 [Polychytrium aggregatum]